MSAVVSCLKRHTLGLNKPGSQTEFGVEMLPEVQLFSCSYLFKTSCARHKIMRFVKRELEAFARNERCLLTMYQDVNENTSWYRVDT